MNTLQKIIEDSTLTDIDIAICLKVSILMVKRWRTGKSRPHHMVEKKIKDDIVKLSLLYTVDRLDI